MLDYLKEWWTYWRAKDASLWSPAVLKKSRAAFYAAVQRYPNHAPPYPGYGRHITPEQAQANLDWFLSSMSKRLAALQQLLAEFAIPAQPENYTPKAVKAWLTPVIIWSHRCWPTQVFHKNHTEKNAWLLLPRTGDAAIFSIILDLATQLGEIRISMYPDQQWHWDVDNNASSFHHHMVTSRRVILTTAALARQGIPGFIDWERQVMPYYRDRAYIYQSKELLFHPWAHCLDLYDMTGTLA